MRPSRSSLLIVVVLLGWIAGGCARDRHEITPTTLGTDLKQMPRGRMTPFPWPGQSIVESTPRRGPSTTDPEAAMASGPAVGR